MELVMQSAPSINVDALRGELDNYYEIMKNFNTADPRENLMQLSGFTARMSEVRGRIIRGGASKADQDFRTKEVDPFISECDRQFKIWSRLITYAQFDWETSKGY